MPVGFPAQCELNVPATRRLSVCLEEWVHISDFVFDYDPVVVTATKQHPAPPCQLSLSSVATRAAALVSRACNLRILRHLLPAAPAAWGTAISAQHPPPKG